MHSNRRRLFRRGLLAAVVTGLSALAALPAPAGAGAPADARGTEEQLEDLTAEERTLLADLDAVEAEIDTLDDEIAAITAREAEVEARLAAAKAEADEAARLDDIAKRALDDATDRLRDEAVGFYVGGIDTRQHVAAFVLDADSLLDIYRAERYGDTVLDQQEDVVDEFRRIRAVAQAAAIEAENRRAAVEDEREALEVELQRREALKAEQQAKQAQQEGLLADLRARKVALEATLAADTIQSDGIGRELQSRHADQPLAPPMPGSLVYPVPTNTEVGSPYGMRLHPILGYERPHRGADFGCSAGEPIVAAAAGLVIVAGSRGGYGNAVVIDHGGRFATLYGHNTSLDVAVGDQVQPGETIAACGSTGLSTGPHSHFETRIDGNPIDPVSLLPAR